MRVVFKDVIRFRVPSDTPSGGVEIEVRVEPDRFDGWRARAAMRHQDPPGRVELTRTFRSTDRAVATGKMVGWIRGRYPRARALANGRAPQERD